MSEYSEQDLKYASEFRERVHREALAIVRKTRPHVTEVVDRHPVEDYFQEHWDYPGKWYTIVAIPSGYGSREVLLAGLLGEVLSNGKCGLIDLNINQAQKCMSAYAGPYTLNDYTAFMLSGRP